MTDPDDLLEDDDMGHDHDYPDGPVDPTETEEDD